MLGTDRRFIYVLASADITRNTARPIKAHAASPFISLISSPLACRKLETTNDPKAVRVTTRTKSIGIKVNAIRFRA